MIINTLEIWEDPKSGVGYESQEYPYRGMDARGMMLANRNKGFRCPVDHMLVPVVFHSFWQKCQWCPSWHYWDNVNAHA